MERIIEQDGGTKYQYLRKYMTEVAELRAMSHVVEYSPKEDLWDLAVDMSLLRPRDLDRYLASFKAWGREAGSVSGNYTAYTLLISVIG